MPSEINNKAGANTSAFIGLQSYTEAQVNSFFGRDNEIDAVTSLVQLNTLTIVFGRSGTGKTSLLNAGVFPKLRKSYCLPFRIRLEFNDDSPDLVTQIKFVLKKEIDKYGFKAEAYPSSETLWEYFHKEPLWKSITPILVFDQFEEIFTLAKSNPRFAITELQDFWEELSDLIENNIPEKLKDRFLNHKNEINYNYKTGKAKIVFAFREEYLPEFESITSKIPSIKYSRFRLLPMNGHQAYDVITKNWKEKINPAEAKQVVSYFTNETNPDDYKLITVEPSLLSQVCAYIDKERIENGGGKVSADLLNKYPKEIILRTIYDEAVTEANNALATDESQTPINRIKEFLEEKLISAEGFRLKYNLSQNDEALRPGIKVLTAKYFLREDDNAVELTHDVLAPIIKRDREKRRKEAALSAARKKARRFLYWAIAGAVALFIIMNIGSIATYIGLNNAIGEKRDSVASLQQTIHKLDSISKINPGNDTVYIKDKKYSIKELKIIIEKLQHDTTVLNSYNDSLTGVIEGLDKKFIEFKVTLSDLDGLIKSLNLRLHKADSINELNKGTIKKLTDSIEVLRKEKDYWNAKYKGLFAAYEEYKRTHPDIKPNPNPVPNPGPGPDINNPVTANQVDTNNNVILNLYYGTSLNRTKAPGNLTLYLIPYSPDNRKIINAAKLYEIRCDEYNLKKAKGYKIARYEKGTYVFASVPQGKYLVKICTYYGGFYTFKKEANDIKIIEWDAAPPIR